MTEADASPAMPGQLLLAELIATRLCHDLSGLAGTTCGALAIAADDPGFAAEATLLAREAAEKMAARLRLLRAAWSGTEGVLPVAELPALARGLPGDGVTLITDRLTEGGAFSAAAGRLMLNLILLGAESLPGGGTIAVAGDPGGDVVVNLEGPRGAWPAGLASWLTDPSSAWIALDAPPRAAARALQGPLTALVAHAAGLRISMLIGVGRTASIPPLLARMTPES